MDRKGWDVLVEREHRRDLPQSKQLVDQFIEQNADLKVSGEWEGDEFAFTAVQGTRGRIAVSDTELLLGLKLSFLLRQLRGRVRTEVGKELDALIEEE